jgi:hypothetical protein
MLTFEIETNLLCDGEGDGACHGIVVIRVPNDDVHEHLSPGLEAQYQSKIRRLAVEHGWECSADGDFCNLHAAKRRGEPIPNKPNRLFFGGSVFSDAPSSSRDEKPESEDEAAVEHGLTDAR